MLDIAAHPLRRDALGGRQLQGLGIVFGQEAQPAPPREADGPAAAVGEMGAGAALLVKDVARRIGGLEEPMVLRRPKPFGKMFELSGRLHLRLLLRFCISADA